MKNFFKEFKEFISRGNVFELAIGIIIGGAFNTIVKSLVDDVIMPLVGIIIGGKGFAHLNFTYGTATINYGMLIQNIVNFLITAFCIFVVVKSINKIKNLRAQEVIEEKVEEVKKAEDIILLEEIRDALKEIKSQGK